MARAGPGVKVRTKSSFKWVNLRETVRNLERLGVEVEDLKDVFGGISKMVEVTAKAITRDRTGALDAGIKGSRRKNAAVITSRMPTPKATRGKRRKRTPYHRAVYFGTSKHNQPRLPYLEIAIARNYSRIEGMVRAGLTDAMRRAGL